MDGDTSSYRCLCLNRILNNTLGSSTDGKSDIRAKAKVGLFEKIACNHEILTPSCGPCLGIKTQKNKDGNRQHLRNSSVNYKCLGDKLLSYKCTKCKAKEISSKSDRSSDGNSYEGTERRFRKHLPSSSLSETKCSKCDIFGFRVCHRRRRSCGYNMNVIYKLLGKGLQDKNSQDEILKCKHYSLDDLSQGRKKLPLADYEDKKHNRYSLINFDQSNSNIGTKTDSEKEKPSPSPSCLPTPNPCSGCLTNKSILKKVDNNSSSVQQPTDIVTEEDSFRSVSIQPIKIKTKEKRLATVDFPTSNPCFLRKPVVNVCQHPTTKFKVPKSVPVKKRKNDIRTKPKNTVNISVKPSMLRLVIRRWLSIIVIIVWLPCIMIFGLFWLMSYPLRPHHSPKNEDAKNVKKKGGITQKKQNSNKKYRNMKDVRKNKFKWLPQISLSLYAKKILSNVCIHCKNLNEAQSVKPPKTTQNKVSAQNRRGTCLFQPATTTIAYPCERRKSNKDRKRRKSVTFKQSSGKCYSPVPRQNSNTRHSCPELHLKNKEKASCQKKVKAKKSSKKMPKDVDVCVSKKLFNLLQTNLGPSTSKKKTKATISCTSVQIPKCKKICRPEIPTCVKPKKTCDKKCDPVCSKEFCIVASQNKICPLDKNLMTCKPSTTKKCAQATCKSNAVIKFYPPPSQSVDKCFPPVAPAAISIDKVDNDMKTTSIIKFYPCPRGTMHTSGSSTSVKPPKEAKGRKRSTQTNTVSLSSVVKLYHPPAEGDIITFFKSLRRKTKTKNVATDPQPTTSIIKFIPKPKMLPDEEEEGKDGRKGGRKGGRKEGGKGGRKDGREDITDEDLLDEEDATKARSKSAPRTTVVKFYPSPPHKIRTLATSTREYVDPKDRKPTSIIKFFPQPHHRYRTFGSTTDLIRNTKILKFFPSPRHRTRTMGSNTLVDGKTKRTKFTKFGTEAVGTRSKKIETKTPMHTIKFYPKSRPKTRSLSVITRSEKEQRSVESKPTSIIKFFPAPKHKTRSLTTNTKPISVKSSAYDDDEETSPEKGKGKGRKKATKKKRVGDDECKIRTVKKYYLERSTTCNVARMKKKQHAKVQKGEGEEGEKRPKVKRQSKKTMFRGSSEIIKFYPRKKKKLVDRGHKAREFGRDLTVSPAMRPPRKIKSRRTQSMYPPALKPYHLDKKHTEVSEVKKVYTTVLNTILRIVFRRPQIETHGIKKVCTRLKKSRLVRIIFLDNADCTEIFTGKKPCPWMQERFPKFYPAFLVIYNLYNNMIHIFFFLLAACVWCPLFCWCFFFYFFVLRKLVC